MKTTAKFLLSITLILSSCQQGKGPVLLFSNSLDIPRENEVISFTFDEIEGLTGKFEAYKKPLFISGADTLIAQFINYQGDNRPEEVLIEISIPASDSREVVVEWIEEKNYPEFVKKTNIHFARHENPEKDLDSARRLQTVKTEETSEVYQMEGPAWENNKIGFRNYFDLRNGMDIFGKLTTEMVLQNVGLKEGVNSSDQFNFDISYHELSDWGMDILKVGNSLGAGGIALEIEDSLYKLGDNGYGRYEKLYEGPLKSEFRFGFPDWKAAGKVRDIIQYVSIGAGNYYYKSSLFLQENNSDASFVTGIVNMHSEELIEFEAGQNHIAYLTHSRQAEDGNFLTMVIMVNKEDVLSTGKTRESGEGITESFYIKLQTEKGKATDYLFYGFWATGSPELKELENIKTILKNDALKFENPVNTARK